MNKLTVPDNRFMVAELITAKNTYDDSYVKLGELITLVAELTHWKRSLHSGGITDPLASEPITEEITYDEIDVIYIEEKETYDEFYVKEVQRRNDRDEIPRQSYLPTSKGVYRSS